MLRDPFVGEFEVAMNSGTFSVDNTGENLELATVPLRAWLIGFVEALKGWHTVPEYVHV